MKSCHVVTILYLIALCGFKAISLSSDEVVVAHSYLRALNVSASEVVAMDVTIEVGKKDYTIYCFGKLPGQLKSKSSGLVFTPFSDLVKKYKQNPKKYAAKLKVAKALKKAGVAACADVPARPTPTPSGPTPTRVPSPTGGAACDGSGNTTRFSIPSGFTGNKSRGSTIWASDCRACHASPKNGRSFPTIKNALATQPQMLPIRETDQEIADLTAYLNCP